MERYIKIFVLLNVLVYSCLAASDSLSLLEAQFVNVENEIKAASSKDDIVHEVCKFKPNIRGQFVKIWKLSRTAN